MGISSSRCLPEFGTCDVLAILPLLLSAERWPSQPHDGGCSSLRRDGDAEDLPVLPSQRRHLKWFCPLTAKLAWEWSVSRRCGEEVLNRVLQICFRVLGVKVWVLGA